MSYLDLVLEELSKLNTRLNRFEQGLRDVKDALDGVQETLAEVRANQPVTVGKVDEIPNPFS